MGMHRRRVTAAFAYCMQQSFALGWALSSVLLCAGAVSLMLRASPGDGHRALSAPLGLAPVDDGSSTSRPHHRLRAVPLAFVAIAVVSPPRFLARLFSYNNLTTRNGGVHASRQCLTFPTELDRSRDRRAWCATYARSVVGALSTTAFRPLSVDPAAARGDLAEIIVATAQVRALFQAIFFCYALVAESGSSKYATDDRGQNGKIAAAAKSHPETIFFSQSTPRRGSRSARLTCAHRIWRTAFLTTVRIMD